jgi:hypothetical protein
MATIADRLQPIAHHLLAAWSRLPMRDFWGRERSLWRAGAGALLVAYALKIGLFHVKV